MTGYIVFRQAQPAAEPAEGAAAYPTWTQITPDDDPVVAANDRSACRLAAAKLPEEDRNGTFSAVPKRSWKPSTRKVTGTVERDEWS